MIYWYNYCRIESVRKDVKSEADSDFGGCGDYDYVTLNERI
jgi:hypothetical protein